MNPIEECDPWKNGWIQERDQIIPYLSLYMFGTVAPGVAGIYMSAVFGASLSTCSSSINSCAVVIIQDLLKPFLKVSPLQGVQISQIHHSDKILGYSMAVKGNHAYYWSSNNWFCLSGKEF